jgi:hypothetical protein
VWYLIGGVNKSVEIFSNIDTGIAFDDSGEVMVVERSSPGGGEESVQFTMQLVNYQVSNSIWG